MSTVVLGKLTIGQCVPAAFGANAKLLASIQARLAGMLKLQAQATLTLPSIRGRIDGALSLAARLEAQLTIGLPGVSLNIAALAKAVAALEADIAALLSLNIAFGTSGVLALAYNGKLGALGGEVGATLTGLQPASNHANALILVVDDPAVWNVFGKVLITA